MAGADASDGGLEMLVGLGSDAVEKVSPEASYITVAPICHHAMTITEAVEETPHIKSIPFNNEAASPRTNKYTIFKISVVN